MNEQLFITLIVLILAQLFILSIRRAPANDYEIDAETLHIWLLLDEVVENPPIIGNSVEIESEEIAKCIPKEKVYFLKIHKTASTVIEDILLRYAWTRRKTLMRPLDLSLNFAWHVPLQKWLATQDCNDRP